MKKIYEKANEQHIGAVVFYGNTEDHKLYYDEECTEGKEVTFSDLQRAFVAGNLIIEEGTVMHKPVKISNNIVTTISESDSTVILVDWTAEV